MIDGYGASMGSQPLAPEVEQLRERMRSVAATSDCLCLGKCHAVRELLLKIEFSGEAYVLDSGQGGFFGCQKEHLCSVQGGVAGGTNQLARHVYQADADGALNLNIVAERPGKVDALEVRGRGTQVLKQQFESRSNRSLGQLQLANVRLVEIHRACYRKYFSPIGNPAWGQDRATSQPRRNCVDKS